MQLAWSAVLAVHLMSGVFALRKRSAAATCPSGKGGADYCCPMPGAEEVCLETECDKLHEIEAGKLWTAVTTVKNPPADYVGPPHNRMVVMLLDAGGAHNTKTLVLVNPIEPTDQLLEEIKALQTSQKATVRYLLSTGDWHWLFLGHYLPDFPEATAYVPPGRIPNLPEGEGPEFAYTEFDIAAPLASLRPGLQVHNMDGLVQPQMLPIYDMNSTRNELFFFHASTKTAVAGDLFWLWTCNPSATDGLQWPGAEEGSIRVWNAGGTSIWSTFEDKIAEATASALLLLSLDFTRFIPIHGPLGNMVSPNAQPSAKDLVDSALRSRYGILPRQDCPWYCSSLTCWTSGCTDNCDFCRTREGPAASSLASVSQAQVPLQIQAVLKAINAKRTRKVCWSMKLMAAADEQVYISREGDLWPEEESTTKFLNTQQWSELQEIRDFDTMGMTPVDVVRDWLTGWQPEWDASMRSDTFQAIGYAYRNGKVGDGTYHTLILGKPVSNVEACDMD